MLISGPAGVGKTTAAIQMPKPYIIDTEQGSVHYRDLIEKSGGVVFECNNPDDVIREIRSLMTESHSYLTLVIDPITTLFNEAVDEGERTAGTEFGRHYGHANKIFKRLCNLLTNIDMNVVITAHEKNEYGNDMKVLGKTFDGYKKLDYIFDLWVQLDRTKGKIERTATIAKTRLAEFPDQSKFDWSYAEIVKRYGAERLETGVSRVDLATDEQVTKFTYLMSQLKEEDIKRLKIDKALASIGGDIEDMPRDRMEKAISVIEKDISVRKNTIE
jgi:DNA polymerase III delta prime subunit